jgi:CubicO group peptidase (beta-lactamase class C family)
MMNKLTLDANSRLNDLVAPYTRHAPAVAIAVYKNGEPMLNKTWGQVDPDSQRIPVLHDTRFDLASLTKLFTTSAFLTLVSEGLTTLDAPLVSVVPEFGVGGPRPIDGGMDPHSKRPMPTPVELRGQTADPARVTFRHLLTHTSGLAPWRDVFNAAGPAPTPPQQPDPLARETRWTRALEALCSYPFVSTPDGVVRYSDLGLMLLGEATARLHGGPLDAAIKARVLDPLGMKTACFNPVRDGHARLEQTVPTENDPNWRGRRVWGEVHDENACGVGGVAGHAGLFAAADDVARLGQAWLDDTLPISPQVKREAISEQAVTGNERRGLGWMLKSVENSSAGDRLSANAYGHTGFTGTSLWVDPRARLVVALLTNGVYEGRERMNPLPFRRAVNTLIANALA